MIPKHEHLGDLVTTDTEWYRPMADWLDDDELAALRREMLEHDAGFGVVEQGYPCVWGFIKDKPYDLIAEENGGAVKVVESWRGRKHIEFANGMIWSSRWEEWPDVSHLPVVIDNDGRCEGVINMEGDRCNKPQWKTDFCATCQKYDDKVKAGKLRECKYCSSTYHATQSCEQNPKVIEGDDE